MKDRVTQEQAAERATRIATIAAEELIRFSGCATSGIDEFRFAPCQIDDHTLDCIEHLCWHGDATQYEVEDGSIIVQLGDFSVGGGMP